MQRTHPDLDFTHPLPYGALVWKGGVQFVIFSRHASQVCVLLYEGINDREPSEVIALDRSTDRWGDIWSVFVPDIGAGQLYHLQVDGPFDPARGHRFDGKARLIDPYAKALAGQFLPLGPDGVVRPPKCVVVDEHFDWEGDRHLRRKLSETVIYELHVRGFTRSRSSGVKHPGTYLGVIEKIPYLQSLGVTAVELMPVHEFPTTGWHGEKEPHPNYWGYDPLAFFAPHRGYAADPEPGAQVREFKQMVKELHRVGIEVILDVVFNHTAEGNHLGPTLSFKGLENSVYYMLDPHGGYKNYTGCGNTVNGNHPIVREMIFHCLRHWVLNYHVDGFRFDLASILSRNRWGELVPNPPLVEAIAEDPLLADTKIIAEAWDAAGAYQVGSFSNSRWAEWNGRYRDDLRTFWRGDRGKVGALATRLSGSSDLYQPSGRLPQHSINFITSHDGFPLNDLVSYAFKHNDANGEGNRDGDNNNHSANYGVEGPTRRKNVEGVRLRQIKNMLASLLLSQGVPMILAGDECRRTQKGNNNAYCQDNDVSWFNWKLVDKNPELVRFCRELIRFRRAEPTVRREFFLRGEPDPGQGLPDVSWFDALGHHIDWSEAQHSLLCLFGSASGALARVDGRTNGAPTHEKRGRHVMLMVHAGTQPQTFRVPSPAHAIVWRKLVDTAAATPRDVFPEGKGPVLRRDRVKLQPRSLMCYVADR